MQHQPALLGNTGMGVTLLVPLPTTPRSTTAAGADEGPAPLLLLMPCPSWEGPKVPAICEKAACSRRTMYTQHLSYLGKDKQMMHTVEKERKSSAMLGLPNNSISPSQAHTMQQQVSSHVASPGRKQQCALL